MTKHKLSDSWFPLRVIYTDTGIEVLVKTPRELRTGVEFIITETRVNDHEARDD